MWERGLEGAGKKREKDVGLKGISLAESLRESARCGNCLEYSDINHGECLFDLLIYYIIHMRSLATCLRSAIF